MQLNIHDRNKVIDMLRFEQKVRYSPEIQKVYSAQYATGTRNVSIEKEIQKYVLKTFGYSDDQVEEYWKIPRLYWQDEEVKNSIFYMKLNIFTYGDVSVGDKLIDVPLYDFQTNSTVYLDTLYRDKPLVILAGSMT
jgi:hypothetical protein